MTVQDFWQHHFEPDYLPSLRPGGQLCYRTVYRCHVEPEIGCQELQSVDMPMIQAIIRRKTTRYAPSMLRHMAGTISAIFGYAKACKKFSGDLPTEGLRMPAHHAAEKQPLTWKQVEELASLTSERTGLLIRLLARTGMRIGEAQALRWENVNLTDAPVMFDGRQIAPRTIRVTQSRSRFGDGPPKTRAGLRDIPLDSVAYEDFVQLSALSTGGQGCSADRVFVGAAGQPLNGDYTALVELKPAARQLGRPDCSWHVLRHTWSTLADAAGLSVAQRQIILGHTAGSMTLRYTHADLEGCRTAMEGVGKS